MRTVIRNNIDFYIKQPNELGCRKWSRAHNGEGRPLFRTEEGKCKLVCRFLLERKLGRPLLKTELACHTCDNPWCCNIDHLWVGSDQSNMDDKVLKDRQYKPTGIKHPKVKLTEEDILRIRSDNRMYIEIAPDYKVSKSLIGAIKRREIWKHI